MGRGSEVDAEVYVEATVVRGVKLVVADVGETDVIAEVGIEHVVGKSAAHAQSAVEALEAVA